MPFLPSSSLLAMGLSLGLVLAFAPAARADVLITINKNTQTMDVSVDGQQRYEWSVSTGRAGYNTPSGTYTPNRMDPTHVSKQYDNAPMPFSIFFDLKGHAIHGTDEVSGLGRPVSHGCVRLLPQNAGVLFNLVKQQGMYNTKVVIEGHIPGGGALPATTTAQNTRRGKPGWFNYPGNKSADAKSSREQRRAWRQWRRQQRYYSSY